MEQASNFYAEATHCSEYQNQTVQRVGELFTSTDHYLQVYSWIQEWQDVRFTGTWRRMTDNGSDWRKY